MRKLTKSVYYYALLSEFRQAFPSSVYYENYRPMTFFAEFRDWLKETYNIDNDGTVVLTFENDEDCTIFLLKWT